MRAKYPYFIVAITLLCLCACKKDGTQPGKLTGKWSVINDSTYVGVGVGNHAVAYVGQIGDYFNFTANGTLYTKEGPVLDTLSYTLVSDTSVIIQQFGLIANGVPSTSKLINLSEHSVTIASPTIFTPGGIFGRRTKLGR